MQENIDELFQYFGKSELVLLEHVKKASHKFSVSMNVPSLTFLAGVDLTEQVHKILVSEVCTSLEQIIIEKLNELEPEYSLSLRQFKVNSIINDEERHYATICRQEFDYMAWDHKYCVCTSAFPTRLLPYKRNNKVYERTINSPFRYLNYVASTRKTDLYAMHLDMATDYSKRAHKQFVFSNGPIVKISVASLVFKVTDQRTTAHVSYNIDVAKELRVMRLQNIL